MAPLNLRVHRVLTDHLRQTLEVPVVFAGEPFTPGERIKHVVVWPLTTYDRGRRLTAGGDAEEMSYSVIAVAESPWECAWLAGRVDEALRPHRVTGHRLNVPTAAATPLQRTFVSTISRDFDSYTRHVWTCTQAFSLTVTDQEAP